MTAAPSIVRFDEPLPAGIDAVALLGGKGAGLAEMANVLGLPVPPGFVVTTAVSREFSEAGLPEELREAIKTHVAVLARGLGRGFGDPERPLLVSVRSGAPVSMPGMMDTLLNVGMTPAVRDGLARLTGNAAFADDTWLRFCRMYTDIVLGMPKDEIAAAEQAAGSASAASGAVLQLAALRGGIPADPMEQLFAATEAVFRSWNSGRAKLFRAHEGIDDNLGTAAIVQAMVFGNLDGRSGTGVVFTRDPATGDPAPFGDYLAQAQGEDVVAGTHAVGGLDVLFNAQPEVHVQLLATLDRLERHYRDMCDVEFTVSSGKLFILQTRIGRRSPVAAVRIAVAMAEDPDFPLDHAEAAARIDETILAKLAAQGSVRAGAVPAGSGLAASPGVGSGALCTDPARAADLSAAGVSVVLARTETSPEDIQGMIGAAALVTTLGGVASHAAVVARGWAIPAICSLVDAAVEPGLLRVGDVLVSEGETVTVDGTSGRLFLGDARSAEVPDLPELRLIRQWAAAEAPAATARETGAATLFDIVRAIQLKGLCPLERVAVLVGGSEEFVSAEIETNPAYFRSTPRGWALTPDGRAWVTSELQAEAARLAGSVLHPCYGRFEPLNHEFKVIVTGWQAIAAIGANDEQYAAMVSSVEALHAEFSPIVDEVAGACPRLGGYGARFEAALEALRAGDATMLASPLKDSYHTVWFEYHEELIALTGRDRATEEGAR